VTVTRIESRTPQILITNPPHDKSVEIGSLERMILNEVNNTEGLEKINCFKKISCCNNNKSTENGKRTGT
jgi:hypothetical protein